MASDIVIRLDRRKAAAVGIEMNMLLRNVNLSLEYAEAYNTVFKAIFGHDHESMERRRPRTLVQRAMDFQLTGRL